MTSPLPNWVRATRRTGIAIAPRVKMTPNAVAVTVHRWRDRYKKLLREEILRTVADPAEIEDELHRFFAVPDK